MSHQNELSLGDAIELFLNKNGLKEESKIQEIIVRWAEIMGKPIAENTQSIWFREGILHITISSPVWKQELSLGKRQIRKLLNQEIKDELIQEVRIH